VWWAAILEREDVITGVVVAADNVALPVLGVTPGAEGGDRFLIEGNRLVGVLGLAARLVPGVPPDDHSIVVHGDLAGVEVDGRPFEAAHLAAPDSGRQFQ